MEGSMNDTQTNENAGVLSLALKIHRSGCVYDLCVVRIHNIQLRRVAGYLNQRRWPSCIPPARGSGDYTQHAVSLVHPVVIRNFSMSTFAIIPSDRVWTVYPHDLVKFTSTRLSIIHFILMKWIQVYFLLHHWVLPTLFTLRGANVHPT